MEMKRELLAQIALALEDSAHHCWCSELRERGMGKTGTAIFCKKQGARFRGLAKKVKAHFEAASASLQERE